MVPPVYDIPFKELLRSNQIPFDVKISDVQRLMEETEKIEQESDRRRRSAESTEFDFHRYQSYDNMVDYLYALERENPEIARVKTIGYSHENRPLLVLKISDPVWDRRKRSVWLDGGLHAREWAAQHTAFYSIDQLIKMHRSGVESPLRNLTWYVMPVANPDGYVYSRSRSDVLTRLWRKNRSPTECTDRYGERVCCQGVDLNRNFDFYFEEKLRSSASPCHPNYSGKTAFSEPESLAIRDFILQRKDRIGAYISLHTYGQILIHPYGHRKRTYPPDYDEIKSLGDKAISALQKKFRTRYILGSTADTMYEASGTSVDWAKQEGVKYSYLIEMRPDRSKRTDPYSRSGGFFLDEYELFDAAQETFEGVRAIAQGVIKLERL